MNKPRFQKRTLFLFAYLLFALLPIYWMLNMSFKTNEESSHPSRFGLKTLRWLTTSPFLLMSLGTPAISTV